MDTESKKNISFQTAHIEALKRKKYGMLASRIGLILVLCLMASGVILKIQRPGFGANGPFFLSMLIGSWWCFMLGKASMQYDLIAKDLEAGVQKLVNGVVTKELTRGIGFVSMPIHKLNCNNEQYVVSKEIFWKVVSGEEYQLSLAPLSNVVLEIDPVLRTSGQFSPNVRYYPESSTFLKKREQEVLELIADGLSNQEIADQLFLSVPTIKMYASQIYRKLGVNRRTEAVTKARHLNLLAV